MSKINTLQDLLAHELRDLYSAETQLLKTMPRMAKETTSEKLLKAFETHKTETEEHVARLEQIAESMGIKPTGHTCKGMKGLLEEAKEMIAEDAPDEVKDAGLISQAQRVEHYEIAGYGTAIALAQKLGLKDAVKLLQKTLAEEKKTDELLTKIAESEVNEHAAAV